MQHSTVQCNVIQYNAVQCFIDTALVGLFSIISTGWPNVFNNDFAFNIVERCGMEMLNPLGRGLK